MRHVFRGVPAALLLCVLACADGEPRSPTATVEAFLEAMEVAGTDHRALARAFDLLASDAQKALRERAAKAKALGGRALEPWQMLVQGRFRLRFEPTSMRERVRGETAVVTVVGRTPVERAEVPLIREGERWKLALRIEPMQGHEAAPAGSPAVD